MPQRLPISFLLAGLLWLGSSAAGQWPERAYQTTWCNAAGGRMEVVLADRTRVDCVTASHAVEVDFARKWREGIRQSNHYAKMTGLQPGIVLILETPGESRFLERLRAEIKTRGLATEVWVMRSPP